ncbi:MAG: hypothetical protein QM723_02205 [Myxococcaceae bacterium]
MLDAPLPKVRERAPEVPPEVEAIVSKAMARELKDRYATAHELSEAINNWLKGRTDAPSSANLAKWMEGLFATRIAEKEQLIQAASRGEIQIIETPQALRPGSSSMPSVDVTQSRIAPAAVRQRQLLIGGAALGAALLGLVLWFVAFRKPEAPQVVTVVEVQQPPQVKVTPPPPPPEPPPVVPVDPPVAPTADPVKKVIAVGKLTLDTTPWTEVYLGSKHLGTTPLYMVTVPAGPVKLRLVNSEKGVDKRVEIQVSAGKTTTSRLKL